MVKGGSAIKISPNMHIFLAVSLKCRFKLIYIEIEVLCINISYSMLQTQRLHIVSAPSAPFKITPTPNFTAQLPVI